MHFIIAGVVLSVLFFWGAFNDRYGIPTLAFLVALVGFHLFGGVDVLAFAAANVWTLLAGLGVYLVIGAGYSFYKWWSYARKDMVRQRINRRREVRRNPRLEEDEPDWEPKVPKARRHKSLITGWIGFWPFSLIITLIDDPLRALINWMFRRLRDTYDAIALKAKAWAMGVNLDEVDGDDVW